MSTTAQQRDSLPSTSRLSTGRPGYKQMQVSVIPEDWATGTLREHLVQPATYGIVKAGRFVYSGVPMVRSGDIREGAIALDLPHVTPEKSEEFSRTVLSEGDIVVALVGYPGEAALVPGALRGANISRAVGLLRPKQHVCAAFLVAYLNSPMGRRDFLKPGAGSAQLVVNLRDLNLLQVPLPSRAEQRVIVEVLSDVDELIGALDKLIAKKRAIRQGAMRRLLTGRTRLPGFSGQWQAKRLGDECELVTKGTTPTSLGRNFTEQGINFVKVESINEDGSIVPDMLAAIDEETHSLLRRSQLKENDILFSIAGALGRTTIVTSDVLPANTNQALAIIRLRPLSSLLHQFLLKYLSSPQIARHVMAINVRGAQANLSLRDIQDFMVPVPSADEQIAIATVLSDVDAEIAALERRREKVKAIKQGMMQELLTGRIRLVEPGAHK